MQHILKALGLAKPAKAQENPEYVLVPPLFERDIKDRDRFAKSSYDYLFGKRQLQYLFTDYLVDSHRGVLLFSPPADDNLTVAAEVSPGVANMNLRYQPLGSTQTATFLDVNVTPKGQDLASFRCSLFEPSLGCGVFVTAPMAAQRSKTRAQVGLRYSSPSFTIGAMAEPATNRLAAAWMVGKYEGLVAGLQLQPAEDGVSSLSCVKDVQSFRNQSSLAVAYEPSFSHATGRGQFSACVEWKHGKQLVVSFFQHMAQIRKVVNPVEDTKVVGITNYVDIGIQICIPTVESEPKAAPPADATRTPAPQDEGSIQVAAAWQINKNWLLKALVSDTAATAAVAVKTWGRLGLVAAANVTYRYHERALRYGAHLQLENFGEKRYERGASTLSGRAVLQRHEAALIDIANAAGQGPLVLKDTEQSDYNPPATDQTATYL